MARAPGVSENGIRVLSASRTANERVLRFPASPRPRSDRCFRSAKCRLRQPLASGRFASKLFASSRSPASALAVAESRRAAAVVPATAMPRPSQRIQVSRTARSTAAGREGTVSISIREHAIFDAFGFALEACGSCGAGARAGTCAGYPRRRRGRALRAALPPWQRAPAPERRARPRRSECRECPHPVLRHRVLRLHAAGRGGTAVHRARGPDGCRAGHPRRARHRRDATCRPPTRPAELLVETLLAELPAPSPRPEDASGLILNGLGAVKYEELFVVYRRVARLLSKRRCRDRRPGSRRTVTSFDMAGLSLTLFWLTEELEPLWTAPPTPPPPQGHRLRRRTDRRRALNPPRRGSPSAVGRRARRPADATAESPCAGRPRPGRTRRRPDHGRPARGGTRPDRRRRRATVTTASACSAAPPAPGTRARALALGAGAGTVLAGPRDGWADRQAVPPAPCGASSCGRSPQRRRHRDGPRSGRGGGVAAAAAA